MKILNKLFNLVYTVVVLMLLIELFVITYIAVGLNLDRVALWAMRTAYAACWWSHYRGVVSDRDFEELYRQYTKAEEKFKER